MSYFFLSQDYKSMKMTEIPKKRLRDWLTDELNEGETTGLRWVNKEDNIFEIEWKHASKGSYMKDKDGRIFYKWALYTGTF